MAASRAPGAGAWHVGHSQASRSGPLTPEPAMQSLPGLQTLQSPQQGLRRSGQPRGRRGAAFSHQNVTRGLPMSSRSWRTCQDQTPPRC